MDDEFLKEQLSGLKAVVWDADDYFFNLVEGPSQIDQMALLRKYSGESKIASYMNLVEVYYYLNRNSTVLIHKEEASESLIKGAERVYNTHFAAWAHYLADRHLDLDERPQPGWIKILVDEIKQHASSTSPLPFDVDHIQIVPRHENSQIVVARQNPDRIEISVILKPLLVNYNLFVHLLLTHPATLGSNITEIGQVAFAWFLPYFLHGSHNIWSSRLPRIRVMSQEHYTSAKFWAHNQVLFLLLHEFGHIAMGHLHQSFSDGDSKTIEEDCDAFAARLLFGWPLDQIQSIYLAIEILFGFQAAMVDTANRFLPVIRKHYVPCENTFADRRRALLRIKGPERASDDIRAAVGMIQEVFKVYRQLLAAIDDQQIVNFVAKYTARGLEDEFIDMFSRL